jgi:enterochelin esterase family protein
MALALIAGSEAWWQTKTGPEWCLESEGNYQVTFWWRDPAGTETHLTTHVWIYITGVTDHHQNATPQSLARIPGTDVWCWQTHAGSDWRGSYCFIPSDRADDFSPQVFAQLRTAWRCAKAGANCCRARLPIRLTRIAGVAGAAIPCRRWRCPAHRISQAGIGRCRIHPATVMTWHSQRLNNHRRVWVYATGDDPALSARWRYCSTASSGPKACRSGPRWPP